MRRIAGRMLRPAYGGFSQDRTVIAVTLYSWFWSAAERSGDSAFNWHSSSIRNETPGETRTEAIGEWGDGGVTRTAW